MEGSFTILCLPYGKVCETLKRHTLRRRAPLKKGLYKRIYRIGFSCVIYSLEHIALTAQTAFWI
jgi:hypothetical protein